ncbi:hypothetical protein NQD34_014994 [Periophthalmus magnuspinnatus]|nr:hypothetical protein NQD34_014994 [Periophthalmus magnuspinnatus]
MVSLSQKSCTSITGRNGSEGSEGREGERGEGESSEGQSLSWLQVAASPSRPPEPFSTQLLTYHSFPLLHKHICTSYYQRLTLFLLSTRTHTSFTPCLCTF